MVAKDVIRHGSEITLDVCVDSVAQVHFEPLAGPLAIGEGAGRSSLHGHCITLGEVVHPLHHDVVPHESPEQRVT